MPQGPGVFGRTIVPGSLASFSVAEIFPGKQGVVWTFNKSREYVRKFKVLTDSPFVDEVQVCRAIGVQPLDPYFNVWFEQTGDVLALAGRFEAERENPDDWQSWIATITYYTDLPDYGPDGGFLSWPNFTVNSQNFPWLEPPSYRWEAIEDHKAPATDLNGKAYLNSALQPFSPPPMFDTGYSVLVIERNLQTFNSDTIFNFQYAVNSDPFPATDLNPNPPGTCQCLPPTAVKHWRGTVSYYRATFKIRIRNDIMYVPNHNPFFPPGYQRVTWQPLILNAGVMRLLTKADGTQVQAPIFLPTSNIPITQPVPLDLEGMPMGVEELLDNGPFYLQFTQYPSIDLNILINGFPGP